MKYLIKWTTYKENPTTDTNGSLLPNTELISDVSYYKKMQGFEVNGWIDVISRATEFKSLKAAEKEFNRLNKLNYNGVLSIEESIGTALEALVIL